MFLQQDIISKKQSLFKGKRSGKGDVVNRGKNEIIGEKRGVYKKKVENNRNFVIKNRGSYLARAV